ncbi:hypothetical protein PPSIR1_11065 [Plesiocystis pacifica SIR-1]|uniref:Cytochrome c7-like domain-containing protein n=1 Tax=Plesiocystis pacifica SIR-1 TaxID=391625 RepID=A6GH72_9BACT|nr:cytochrome c3 family protein [Plesiocystis pacifica]EDM74794.1 hypothetical protein PPSIR1_11065 [Plesiocystis pacifica SIR-1]
MTATERRWATRVSLGLGALGLSVLALSMGQTEAEADPISEPPATLPRSEGPKRPGGPVYPPQELRVRMNHGKHLAAGVQCKQCHTRIETSALASQNDLPTGEACDLCHGDQHPAVNGRTQGDAAHCADCHTHVDEQRVTATTRIPKPRLIFSHQAHLQRGAACEDCHGDMAKVGLATQAQLPSEADCLACHQGKPKPKPGADVLPGAKPTWASATCSTCHPSGADGRLETAPFGDPTAPKLLPRGPSARGAGHDLAFVEDHRGIAKADPSLCAACHDDEFCADCHAGPIRPMRIHAGDYLSTHAIDAKAASQDCSSCHRLQSECKACHLRVGVGTSSDPDGDGSGSESRFGLGSSLSFHPPGWASADAGGALGGGHARAAQKNISACVSCHDEDSCLACHATTDAATPGLGASPHGPGFANSTRCAALERRNRRACLRCHAPGDIALSCL